MKKIIAFIGISLLAAACEKGSVSSPDFKVTVASTTVKAGTPVVFSISGNTDLISFYSGELGNDYAYKTTDRITPTTMFITFSTENPNGTPGHGNPSRVPFCYSFDFNSADKVYTVEDVTSATWTDFTDRFKMPTDINQTVASGEVSINELFPDAQTPMYLMFHYCVDTYDASLYGGQGNPRTQWLIKNFRIDGVTEAGNSTLYPFVDCNWQVVETESFEDNGKQHPNVNTTRILMYCDAYPKTPKECYVIGGPFYRQADINTGPDLAEGIKSTADPMPSTYEHTFEQPGTYTVTFVGINSSVYGRKEAIRQLTLTVVEDSGGITPPDPGEWND